MASTVFAYDGSTHGDWVARYAVRLARSSNEGLVVVHVDEPVESGQLAPGLLALEALAEASGVSVETRHVARSGRSVAAILDDCLPVDPDGIVVTGLRARESGRGLLAGTVSEHLLKSARHNILAIRVVSPGLLGHARHVLQGLSENPQSARRSVLFLKALAPEMTRLSLLSVFSPRLGRLSRPTGADLSALRTQGMAYLRLCEEELRRHLEPFAFPIDPHVSVSTDWATELVRHAGRVQSGLLLLGATERSLPRRLLLGNPLERVLHETVCDVALFRRAEVLK